MIEQLIQVLERAKLQTDYHNLRDMLWLSRFLPAGIPTQPSQDRQVAPPIKSESSEPFSIKDTVVDTRGKQEQTSPRPRPDLYSTSSSVESGPSRARPILVTGAPALPGALEIARALRPFARRLPSRQRWVFDEEATIKYIGDGGPVMPLQQPAMERWFDIALLVEEAPSLGIWQKLVAEFQQLLSQHGAFRDVRRWYFQAVDGKVLISSLSGVPCNPRQLHHPTSRRLILVLSDCVSRGWYDGAIASVLADWGAKMPVMVVQMLPEELWRHTALGPVTFALRALLPDISNKNLSVEKPAWIVESGDVTLPLPVVKLEPAAINQWTRMVMAGGTSAPGVCLPLQPEQVAPETSSAATRQKDSEEQSDPEQRIQTFRALVSPTAFKLAIYLSTLRLLTLPVMRLVQQSMLPKSQPVHLAEVFLGGLLERVTPAAEKRLADEVVYDFYQGVREILVKWVSRSEADKLIDNISAYIESHEGFDFVAYIQDASGEVSLPAEAVPFARPFLDNFTTFLKRTWTPLGPSVPSDIKEKSLLVDVQKPHNYLLGGSDMDEQMKIKIMRDKLQSGGYGPELVVIPKGQFLMGSSEAEFQKFIDMMVTRGTRASGPLTGSGIVVRGLLHGLSFAVGPILQWLGVLDKYNEGPQHEVSIDKPFALGKFPVTFSDYSKYEGTTKKPLSSSQGQFDFAEAKRLIAQSLGITAKELADFPVVDLNWYNAIAYVNWLSEQTGYTYRLPTEVEWEYSARGGTRTPYWWGDEILKDHANCKGHGTGQLSRVHQYPPNPFGLHDMLGNVLEWTCSGYDEVYRGKERSCVSASSTNALEQFIVLRGGSCVHPPRRIRCAARNPALRSQWSANIGFRILRELVSVN